jgi:hypothetical protein
MDEDGFVCCYFSLYLRYILSITTQIHTSAFTYIVTQNSRHAADLVESERDRSFIDNRKVTEGR